MNKWGSLKVSLPMHKAPPSYTTPKNISSPSSPSGFSGSISGESHGRAAAIGGSLGYSGQNGSSSISASSDGRNITGVGVSLVSKF